MAENSKRNFDLDTIRNKVKTSREEFSPAGGEAADSDEGTFSWSAVSRNNGAAPRIDGLDNFLSYKIDFVGKNLENGRFAHENLSGANFSVANLKGVDFSGANLRGVDFSGADLTGANLQGADLTGAVLSGAQLVQANFSGAILNKVVLTDADIQDAVLLDIEIDELGLEELQALVEYLAQYYPHKLNLARMNLLLLDLKRIDLKNVSLRGVDFTGVDFTGVNIMDLDLSETNITPQQIAQALGRMPNAEELKRLMAPKEKKGKSGREGIDISGLFLDDGREVGTWDTLNDKGISLNKILDAGRKVFRRSAPRPPVKDEKILEQIKEDQKQQSDNHKDELRRIIEQHKREELESRRQKMQELAKEKENNNRAAAEKAREMRIRSRGGNER